MSRSIVPYVGLLRVKQPLYGYNGVTFFRKFTESRRNQNKFKLRICDCSCVYGKGYDNLMDRRDAKEAIEKILFRRALERRLEGYTLETAVEIEDALSQPSKVYIPSAHPIETAWLLEYPVTEGCSRTNPLWLSIVEGAFHWTADANTATRFARQEDAQRVASLTRWELSGLIATEHQWS